MEYGAAEFGWWNCGRETNKVAEVEADPVKHTGNNLVDANRACHPMMVNTVPARQSTKQPQESAVQEEGSRL